MTPTQSLILILLAKENALAQGYSKAASNAIEEEKSPHQQIAKEVKLFLKEYFIAKSFDFLDYIIFLWYFPRHFAFYPHENFVTVSL